MKVHKLNIKETFNGLIAFSKEEFKRLGTWVMISILSYLGIGVLCLIAGLLIGLNVLYFIFNSPAIFNTQQPLVGILSLLATGLNIFIIFKLVQKGIGFSNVLVINAIAAAEGKELPKLKEKDGRLSFLLYTFLFLLITVLGLLFLVIPGVLFYIRFIFGYFIMLEEKCSPIQALKRSWDMTEGHFWQLFVFVAPLACISSFLPPLIIVFMFIPVNAWMIAYLYQQVKEHNKLN